MGYKIAVFAPNRKAFKNFESSQSYGIACYWIQKEEDTRAREFNLVAILPDTEMNEIIDGALHWARLRTKDYRP